LSGELQLNLNRTNLELIPIKAEENTTVGQFKRRTEYTKNVSYYQINLTRQEMNHHVEDLRTLKDYNIKDNSNLHLWLTYILSSN
jgi:hypothetical protein